MMWLFCVHRTALKLQKKVLFNRHTQWLSAPETLKKIQILHKVFDWLDNE